MQATQLHITARGQTHSIPVSIDTSWTWNGLLNMVKSTIEVHRREIRLHNVTRIQADPLRQLTQLLVS